MKTVYTFGGNADHSDERQKDKTVTGGKGANLAEMASIGLPVPPGFTITTEECVKYLQEGAEFSGDLRAQVAEALKHIEATVGKSFGDASDPLLVSVRSGARVSMPGMMDTVLNLGLNDETVEGLSNASGDERFAWDTYRRLHPDVFGRGAGPRSRAVRGSAGDRQGRQGLLRRHRDGGGRLEGTGRRIQDVGGKGTGPSVPSGCDRAAVGRNPRRVRQLG